VNSRIWTNFLRYWESDRGLSILLASLLCLIFLIPALGLVDRPGRLAIDVLFTLVMLAGVMSISKQRGAMIAVGTIAILGLSIRWIGRLWPSEATSLATSLSTVVSVATLSVVVLIQVFRAGPVNRHRVFGAMAVYLLLGIAWAETYDAISLVRPDAFNAATRDAADPQRWIYYSFVTLTTVGYGDITPVAPLARSLAILEALTGQLFPAILLARLVALEVSSQTKH
jgi:voltage-gated potassium channel Kch